LKVVSQETLKDFPPKWDLADPLPEGKPNHFIENAISRAESKAISLDKLNRVAERNGIGFEQLNAAVCLMDTQLRGDLEKKYGANVAEIESAILGEALKSIQIGGVGKPPYSISAQSSKEILDLKRSKTHELEMS